MELLFKQTLVTTVSQLHWTSLFTNAWGEELDSPPQTHIMQFQLMEVMFMNNIVYVI